MRSHELGLRHYEAALAFTRTLQNSGLAWRDAKMANTLYQVEEDKTIVEFADLALKQVLHLTPAASGGVSPRRDFCVRVCSRLASLI